MLSHSCGTVETDVTGETYIRGVQATCPKNPETNIITKNELRENNRTTNIYVLVHVKPDVTNLQRRTKTQHKPRLSGANIYTHDCSLAPRSRDHPECNLLTSCGTCLDPPTFGQTHSACVITCTLLLGCAEAEQDKGFCDNKLRDIT